MLRRAVATTRGRFLLLATFVAAFALGSAAIAQLGLNRFPTYGDAVWSALVHLLDPSTLQEDTGRPLGERLLALAQVLVGLVVLAGVLFTVLAEVVGRTLERLGQIESPVHEHGHLLVAGGNELLAPVVGAIAGGQRPIVVLAPLARRDDGKLLDDVRSAAPGTKVRLVHGRLGTPDAFALGAARDAAATVLLPTSAGRTLAEAADMEVLQSGLALQEHLGHDAPTHDVRLVFRRGRNTDAAWDLLPQTWDAVVGDRGVAACLAAAVAHPRFAPVLPGMRALGPLARPRVLPAGAHAGVQLADLVGALDGAVPIGLLHDGTALVPPPAHAVVDGADAIVVLPAGGASQGASGSHAGPTEAHRVLVVGWSVSGDAFLEELAQRGRPFELSVLAPEGVGPRGERRIGPLAIRRLDGAAGSPHALQHALDAAQPDVVLVSSTPRDWDPAASDAEAVLTVLQIRRLTAETPIMLELVLPRRMPDIPRVHAMAGVSLIADAVGLTVRDAQAALVGEALLGGESARLEPLQRPADAAPTTFGALAAELLAEGASALALATADAPASAAPPVQTPVRAGDVLLLARAARG